jgi:CubicO group peptidase (beta-lactamase class C family)
MNRARCVCRASSLMCLFAFLGGFLLATPAEAQQNAIGIHGASDVNYQSWIDKLPKGYRVVAVSGYGLAGTPQFAGVAINDGTSPAWVARHNLTSQAYQQEFDKWTGMGYRLLCFTGYARGNSTNLAAVWVKDGANVDWIAHHDQSSQQYQQTFDALTKKGYRPIYLAGYPVGKSYALASIFVADKVTDWAARHDLASEQYQTEFDIWDKKGYRPITLTAYPTPNGTRFAVVFQLDKATSWSARHHMTANDYQKEFDKQASLGFRPGQVVGYPWQGEGEIRYAAFFIKPPLAVKYPLPVSGKAVPELVAFDNAMQKFMKERNITAGTLAVMKDGKLVLSRGYGYRDPMRGQLLGPDAPLRFASIGKPITLAAIMELIRQGKLALTTKAFALLGIKAPPGGTMDKRFLDITIKDLTEHKGGWDRDKAGDPMFMSLEIAKALGKPGPASADDIMHYMAGQPLQFTPGSKMVYSNFGYCVLGRVIEKVTGKKYVNYIRDDLLAPLGIKSITLGHSLPAGRNPEEPLYFDPGSGRNVVQPKSTQPVPAPDGTFYLEAMDSHGGLIGTAPDLVRFLQAYWMDGSPRKPGQSATYNFFGSLPGTWTVIMQRPGGLSIAALFNQRTDPSGLSYDKIENVLDVASNSVKNWPGQK